MLWLVYRAWCGIVCDVFSRQENRPAGAKDRCVECPVERTCPYSACKVYLDPLKRLEGPARYTWPQSVVHDVPEGVTWGQYRDVLLSALRTGPYGRCVYACDNDVCDNQVRKPSEWVQSV
ncbi:hypothetical protein PR048_024428 [Dryococelus australis]|uniref:4Fe-4S ferredoxin-type domain-containing protein n=1 Tax=Dryococelus australis TaxID=614101 RepID=A0ABQ9GNM2_9NEOP|nr:hypothetical protein PR048_024428 [Dryococelus australis]